VVQNVAQHLSGSGTAMDLNDFDYEAFLANDRTLVSQIFLALAVRNADPVILRARIVMITFRRHSSFAPG